jgi:hypothetical protein
MPRLVGTPTEIAHQLEYFIDEGGADGFMLAATYTPGCFEEFVDLVVPELQTAGTLPYPVRASASGVSPGHPAKNRCATSASEQGENDSVYSLAEGIERNICRARSAADNRFSTPSLVNIFFRCARTVSCRIPRIRLMTGLLLPAATQ